MVDVPLSLEKQREWPADHRGLMRVAMNGTFFTRDKLVHTGKIHDSVCQWCGSDDSTSHRTWECPGFAACRTVKMHELSKTITELLSALLKGWVPEPVGCQALRRALWNQPEYIFTDHIPDSQETNHFFTDGSRAEPGDRAVRVSSWAVVWANLEQDAFFPCALWVACQV